MGRAIAAISGSAAGFLPSLTPALGAFWRELSWHLFDSYHPEQHYMRGPGPKWRAKNGNLPQA